MTSEPRPIGSLMGRDNKAVVNGSGTTSDGTGEFDKHAAAERLARGRRRKAAVEQWMASVPRRYTTAVWDNVLNAEPPYPADVLTDLDDYCHRTDLPPFLLLLGDVGTGKSYCAVAVANRLAVERGLTVRFVLASELLDELRFDNREWLAYKRGVIDADVLILDDILASNKVLTEWEEKQIDAILSRRWMEERATIITTNQGADGLRNALGDRLYDRIRDGVAVAFPGKSRRGL